MARELYRLQKSVRIALQYVANVRNRFCHATPWFLDDEERTRFRREVDYLTEAFQLDYWARDPIKKRVLTMIAQTEQQISYVPVSNQEIQKKIELAQAFAASQRLAIEESQHLLEENEEVDISYENAPNPEIEEKIQGAKNFAASQRLAVCESQRFDDIDVDEVEIEETETNWKCPLCTSVNDISDALCTVCNLGAGPQRWRCNTCTAVNFLYEPECTVCQSPQSENIHTCPKCETSFPSFINACYHCGETEPGSSTTMTNEWATETLSAAKQQNDEDEEEVIILDHIQPGLSAEPISKNTVSIEEKAMEDVLHSNVTTPHRDSKKREWLDSSITSSMTTKHVKFSSPMKDESEPSSSIQGKNQVLSSMSSLCAVSQPQLQQNSNLENWILDETRSTPSLHVYHNTLSNKDFEVEWPLPRGWELCPSSRQPNDRLCFSCDGRKQAWYPPKDTPEGWILIRNEPHRRIYQKLGEPNVLFETQWPLPVGWVLSKSKSRPNQLSYYCASLGQKSLAFPK